MNRIFGGFGLCSTVAIAVLLIESQVVAQSIRHLNTEPKSKWTADDWVALDETIFRNFLIKLYRSDSFQMEIDLSDEQIRMLKQSSSPLAEKIESNREIIAAKQKLAESGRFPEFFKLQDELDAEEVRLSEMIASRVQDVLLPHQLKRLRQLAKMSRLQSQHGTNEFGVIMVLAEESGLSESEQKKLDKAVTSAWLEYLEELKTHREKATKKVFQVLSEEERDKFEATFGVPYDWDGEYLQQIRERANKGGGK